MYVYLFVCLKLWPGNTESSKSLTVYFTLIYGSTIKAFYNVLKRYARKDDLAKNSNLLAMFNWRKPVTTDFRSFKVSNGQILFENSKTKT